MEFAPINKIPPCAASPRKNYPNVQKKTGIVGKGSDGICREAVCLSTGQAVVVKEYKTIRPPELYFLNTTKTATPGVLRTVLISPSETVSRQFDFTLLDLSILKDIGPSHRSKVSLTLHRHNLDGLDTLANLNQAHLDIKHENCAVTIAPLKLGQIFDTSRITAYGTKLYAVSNAAYLTPPATTKHTIGRNEAANNRFKTPQVAGPYDDLYATAMTQFQFLTGTILHQYQSKTPINIGKLHRSGKMTGLWQHTQSNVQFFNAAIAKSHLDAIEEIELQLHATKGQDTFTLSFGDGTSCPIHHTARPLIEWCLKVFKANETIEGLSGNLDRQIEHCKQLRSESISEWPSPVLATDIDIHPLLERCKDEYQSAFKENITGQKRRPNTSSDIRPKRPKETVIATATIPEEATQKT